MIINKNGIEYTLTPAEETQLLSNIANIKAEKEATKYMFDRAKAYPSIADQLDIIYHQGLDAWKEVITQVKEEYPKP